MKNLVGIFIIAGIIFISGCNGNDKTNGETDETQADTIANVGHLNPRGLPSQSIPDNSYLSGDTLIYKGPLEKDSLPPMIQSKIREDVTIRDKRITKHRQFTLENQTMHELTFEGEENLTIIFDETGARVIRKN